MGLLCAIAFFVHPTNRALLHEAFNKRWGHVRQRAGSIPSDAAVLKEPSNASIENANIRDNGKRNSHILASAAWPNTNSYNEPGQASSDVNAVSDEPVAVELELQGETDANKV